jgi:hypothetical protein
MWEIFDKSVFHVTTGLDPAYVRHVFETGNFESPGQRDILPNHSRIGFILARTSPDSESEHFDEVEFFAEPERPFVGFVITRHCPYEKSQWNE